MTGAIFATEPASARHSVPLPIARQPKPARPTLIRPLPEKPLQAASLDELARHVHRLRCAQGAAWGLRIGPLQFATYGGSDTFPGFYLYAIDPESQAETWIGFAAVQAETDGDLRAALRRTETRQTAEEAA